MNKEDYAGSGLVLYRTSFWFRAPNKEEAKKALDELRTLQGKIQSEHE